MNLVSIKTSGKALAKFFQIVADGTGLTARGIRKNAEASRESQLLGAQADVEAQAIRDGLSEYRKVNLTKVAERSVPLLDNIDDPKVNDMGWFADWVNGAAHTPDDVLQDWWARILAGECEKSGSYSKWALDAVAKMSKEDVEHFTRFSSCCWNIGPVVWTPTTAEILGYSEKILERAGLITGFDVPIYRVDRNSQGYADAIYFGQRVSVKTDRDGNIPLGHARMTALGEELIGLCQSQENEEYREDCIQQWKKKGLIV